MRPRADHILQSLGMRMLMKHIPLIQDQHAQAEIGLTATMMRIVSEEFERAAHRRIEENGELRKIFSEAVTIVNDEDLKNRLKAASEKEASDYKVSTLDKLNHELLEVLIDLHAHVEDLEGEDAGKIKTAIWESLEKGVKRREFTWANR